MSFHTQKSSKAKSGYRGDTYPTVYIPGTPNLPPGISHELAWELAYVRKDLNPMRMQYSTNEDMPPGILKVEDQARHGFDTYEESHDVHEPLRFDYDDHWEDEMAQRARRSRRSSMRLEPLLPAPTRVTRDTPRREAQSSGLHRRSDIGMIAATANGISAESDMPRRDRDAKTGQRPSMSMTPPRTPPRQQGRGSEREPPPYGYFGAGGPGHSYDDHLVNFYTGISPRSTR
ncbi:hypothetical protein BJ742DRAFT_786090 [Cladochytrium replicatum]|nr:hypothetical protein BJ742DRAFT_786090 [Cladochytrium replicatum]